MKTGAKGEDGVLTKEKTSKLAVTSGTTGSPSMIPRVQSQEKPIRIAVAALSSTMYSARPQVDEKVLLFLAKRDPNLNKRLSLNHTSK